MTAAPPPHEVPALYEVRVTHRRTERIDRSFSHRMYLWLVDLDHLPVLPRVLRPLARFDAADHLGDPGRSIRANLEDFLASRGVDLDGGRILMLAHARVLSYVFNPITLYWCHRASGELACVVAEVHNTYGGRHHYLLDVDDQGRARVDKEFYVSPFLPVAGEYRMRVPEPGATLSATVVLRQDGTTPFVATMHGHRRPAGGSGAFSPRRSATPWSPRGSRSPSAVTASPCGPAGSRSSTAPTPTSRPATAGGPPCRG